MSSTSYYYEKPFEDTTVTSVTSTTKTKTSKPSSRNRRLIIIALSIFIILIVIVLLFLILNRNTPTSNNANNQTTQNAVLQFWGVYLDTADIQPLLDQYHSLHPNVTIQYVNKWQTNTVYTTAEDAYRKTLDAALLTNNPVQIPDIYMVNNTWAGDYDRQYSAPSTSYDINTFKNDFYPVVATDFAHDGVVHGVPLWIDTLSVLYNKDMLAAKNISAPPQHWSDFQQAAVKLNLYDNTNSLTTGGFASGLVSNTSYPFPLINVLLLQNGVTMQDSTTNAPTFANSAASLDAFNFYLSFAKGSNATWNQSFPNDAKAFLDGQAAMILSTSYRYRDIVAANTNFKKSINIGVAQLPQESGQSQSIIDWADYWGAMVSSQRPNSSIAWDFLNWITQPDQLKKLNQTFETNHNSFGFLYPRSDMQSLQTSDPNLGVYAQELPYAKSWYMVKGVEVRNQFNSLLSSGTIDQGALTTLQTSVTNLIATKENLYTGSSSSGS